MSEIDSSERPREPARSGATAEHWRALERELAERVRELSQELDELSRLPGYALGVWMRSVWRRARGRSYRIRGSDAPRHTARLGGGPVLTDEASLEERVASVGRLRADLEQLQARLGHPGLRPFRWLRACVERVPGHARRRTARAAGVQRRLRERPLPPARPPLPESDCPERVSIVLPTFDRAHLLPRAIASVRQQTYSNWQLIVVDDGSRDDTRALARTPEGGADDPRIVWLHREHAGVSAARNAGLARADGEWIAFLDSDNVWYADFLERHRAKLVESGPEVVASYSDQRWYQGDRRGRTVSKRFTRAELFHLPQVDLNALVVRRSALDAIGGFDPSMNKWVDYELMLRLSAQGTFAHVPRVLGDYYRLEDGISRASDRERPLGPNLARVRAVRTQLLRVGYVLWDYPSASQAFVHRELRALAADGIDVRVYYATDAETPASEPPKVPAHRVRSAEELARLALAHERNLLHGHFAYPTSTVHLWPAAERSGIPFTFTAHGVDLFHRNNERRHRVGRIGSSPLCKAAFAIGSFHADYLARHGVPSELITPIRCPVDPEWFEPLPDFERPLERISLVSRLVAKKGILDFVEVARACADDKLEFELYGYGPLEAEVAQAARAVANLSVRIGPVSEAEVRRICERSSAILLPCRRAADGDMDGLPVILLEGAARGCLLVSSRVSSIPDLVESGRSGYLVEPGDIGGYVHAIRDALAQPAHARAALRRAAFGQVKQEFETGRVVRALIDAWCR